MKTKNLPALFRRLLVVGAVFGATIPGAQGEIPPGCTESAVLATIGVTPLIAHIGDTLTYSMAVGNGDVGAVCNQNNVHPYFFCPSHYPPLGDLSNATVDFGNLGTYEPGDITPLADQPYVVRAVDLVLKSGGNVVTADIIVTGLVDGAVETPTETSQTISTIIVQPKITITKTCRLVSGDGGLQGEATVTITNTGDVDLRDIEVIDDAGTPGNTSDDFDLLFPTTLGEGDSEVKTYTFPLSGVLYKNTVTVTGRDTIPTSVGNEQAAAVTATDDCELEIPRECPTRTIGYWFQHVIPTRDDVKCATLTAAFKFILDEDGDGNIGENRIDLGFIQLPTADRNGVGGLDVEDAVIEALGFFHGKRSVAGDGSRDGSCLARKRLALQLIGATANVLFLNQQSNGNGCLITGEEPGETYTGAELLEAARQAALSCDLSQISYYHGLLDDFNNSGDEMPFEDYGSDGDNSNDLRPCPVGRANKLYIGEHTYDPTTEANCACPE